MAAIRGDTRGQAQGEGDQGPIANPPGYALLADRLREAILRGELAEGEKLRQDAIARAHGVSQAVAREAFKDLVGEGLLRAAPRRGVRVAPLSAVEAEEITALRAAVETQLLAWAAPNLTRGDIAAMGEILELLDRAHGVDRIIELNRRFHERLYRPAGRERSLALVEGLRRNFERYLRFAWRATPHLPQSQRQHRQLLRFCAAGRVDEACRSLRAHIEETGKVIVGALARRPS